MQEHELKLAAQVAAIQYVVTDLAVMVLDATGRDANEWLAKARLELELWSVPGMKPGYSDLLAAETLSAVEGLLRAVQARLDRASRNLP